MRRLVASIALLLALAPTGAQAAGCTVVFGQGRLPPSTDSAANDRWNRLNFSFFDGVQEALAEGGLKTVPVFLALASADAAANAAQLRRAGRDAGCTARVTLSVFEQTSGPATEVVFEVRAERLTRQGDPAPGGYRRAYRFTVSPDAPQQVSPSRLAARAVRELPDDWKR